MVYSDWSKPEQASQAMSGEVGNGKSQKWERKGGMKQAVLHNHYISEKAVIAPRLNKSKLLTA